MAISIIIGKVITFLLGLSFCIDSIAFIPSGVAAPLIPSRFAEIFIDTYLLLSSEIRGYVANPQYYFAGNDIGRAEALDVLMMVQGWTRYDYA